MLSNSFSSGLRAFKDCVDPPADLHGGDVEHHGRAGHGGVERDPPQDGDDVQRLGPRLPGPQLPGQRTDGTGLTRRDGGLLKTGQAQSGHSTKSRPLILGCLIGPVTPVSHQPSKQSSRRKRNHKQQNGGKCVALPLRLAVVCCARRWACEYGLLMVPKACIMNCSIRPRSSLVRFL